MGRLIPFFYFLIFFWNSNFYTAARSNPIDPPSRSGRFSRAVNDLNYHGAFQVPTSGVPQTGIKSPYQVAGKDSVLADENDLVGRLIQDESEIWNRLLDNSFCQKMKTAPSTDAAVTKGFKWYMVQDFLYCARLMLFDTERSTKALNKANYTSLAQRIKDDTDYAVSLLTTCIQNLSIPEATVLQTKREWEVNLYTDFTINVVENFDWVVSLVSMIPCIQSYYYIAYQLQANSTYKNTLWYNNWVLPNNDSSYANAQSQFFIDNYATWNMTSYTKLRKIFREGCQRELDLWAIAEEPGDL